MSIEKELDSKYKYFIDLAEEITYIIFSLDRNLQLFDKLTTQLTKESKEKKRYAVEQLKCLLGIFNDGTNNINIILNMGIKYKCSIAQEIKTIIATISNFNSQTLETLDYTQKYLEQHQGLFWSYIDNFNRRYKRLEYFIKDLMLLATKAELEAQAMVDSGEVVLRKLNKDEAETIVKKILKDEPHTDWSLRKMENRLNGLGLDYGYNSIRTLDVMIEYQKDNPRGKLEFTGLTDLMLKNFDSNGKTHFSRDKKAGNFSSEDD